MGTISCLVYIALYVLLDPVAGALYAPLLLGGTALAKYLVGTYGSVVVYWGIGIHVASWIAQFVGHGKFEGRAPALLDNLFQAVFLAPFFVWIEVSVSGPSLARLIAGSPCKKSHVSLILILV